VRRAGTTGGGGGKVCSAHKGFLGWREIDPLKFSDGDWVSSFML
jgi:hypothetical protein